MKIPKETKYFVYDTSNTHGAIRGEDCVVRSISLAMNRTWLEVYDSLVELGRKKGRMPNDPVIFYQYLKDNGWVMQKQPRKEDNRKYSAWEFVRDIAGGRRCIFGTSGHLSCCLEDRKIHDIWNCGGWCVGRYWVKEN